jgi:DNA-binding response OmpR family regulator
MNHLLLVEDDPAITNLLGLHLHAPDFRVTAFDRGAAALERWRTERFELIILDILLPDGNGIEFCRQIRQEKDWTPVLMLSALADESDKVLALESGADDYLTKPFGVAELMARVRALLRRRPVEAGVETMEAGAGVGPAGAAGASGRMSPQAAGPGRGTGIIEFRELMVDRHKRKVTMRGQRLELTPKEFDLLWLLADHPGKTFSRHELLQLIWGFAFPEYEHTVTSHINRLRIKIEPNLDKPEYILTTWGAGYRFAE